MSVLPDIKSLLEYFRILSLVVIFIPAAAHANTAKDPNDAVGANDDIIVYGRALPQVGIAISGSQGIIGYRDFDDRPTSRVGELVENVPGVIATQHSGTGKANQYFLRGFNLDHGTDFAGFVDGVPINMRTHGHGQGYLDINFLIPELVERLDYRKGPYFADIGDFSAAGTISFSMARSLPRPLAEVTLGSNGYYRGLAAASLNAHGSDLLVALEGTLSNGPWVLDENLRKANGLIKLSHGPASDGWDLGLSLYHADWQATDQVPRRAIDSGLIDRFGFIDPDLGGRTTRASLTFNAASPATRFNAYALFYDFRLTSNFTYFLDDTVNGDQFQQRDRRGVFGSSLRHRTETSLGALPMAFTLGGDLRYDLIGKVGLYRSVKGARASTVREDRVDEYSGALFAEAEISITPRLRAIIGGRGDYFGYDIRSNLSVNSGKGHDALLAPKASLAWRTTDHLELYANYGESFHSNDVRGAVITTDPATGDPAERVGVLIRARGGEIGGRVEHDNFTASLVAYHLTLGSELVFVGDAGATEPNNASKRYGAEVTLFWKPLRWLTLDASGALTHSRFRGLAPDADRIPNAVNEVVSGGVAVDIGEGLSASMRLRHFGAAPLIEDGSARSRPTTLVNLGTYYKTGRTRIGIDLFNLFNARDADITYFYNSRLPGEQSGGIQDYHIHPVEPRQIRITLRQSL